MSRDWMVTGRRPSGLCGAAILIAARIHGFKRTVKQIVTVVNVCDEVIRRRLEEFSNSPMCRLTINEFDSSDLQDDGKGNDPPAFIRNRKKEKDLEKKQKEMELLKQKAMEIEKIFEEKELEKEKPLEDADKNETMTNTMTMNNMTVVNNHMTVESSNSNVDYKEQSNYQFKEETYEEIDRNETGQKEKVLPSNYLGDNEKISLSPYKDRKSLMDSTYKKVEEDENLSDLEEKEASFYILSSEEYKLKKLLWEVLFKDWIDEQRDKKANEKKKIIKKRPRNFSKSDIVTHITPAEAIMNSNKFSKKLNINVLNKLFSKEK